MRSKASSQSLSTEILRQRLRLNTSLQKTRRKIVEYLTSCNPDSHLSSDSSQSRGTETSVTKTPRFPLAQISKLAARSHQLLCENWAYTCITKGSHVAAKRLLTTYRSNRATNETKFELLLSTSEFSYPWLETEIKVLSDPTTSVEIDNAVDEKDTGEGSSIPAPKQQGKSVRFTIEEPTVENKGIIPKRFKIQNICEQVRRTLGTRLRRFVEGNTMRHCRPTHPKMRGLNKATISLSLDL